MKFSSTLLAVRNMERSLAFYKDLFGQEVVCDLGWNKVLSCGLTLQLHFDKIADFPENSIIFKPRNMELYFETDDIESFVLLLEKHPEVEKADNLRIYPWHQRGIRIYDPDGHLIEVSESMKSVAFREFKLGHNIEKTAEITQHPMDLVIKWYEAYKETL